MSKRRHSRAPVGLRRLLVLAGAVLTLAALAGGAYAVRRWHRDESARAARESGLAALARGDDEAAIAGLQAYLQRFEKRTATAADFTAFARARRRVPLADGAHLALAASALRQALAREAGNSEAQSELLEIHMLVGQRDQALALVETMLRTRPDDAALRRKQRDLLLLAGRTEDALEAAERVNRLLPDSLTDHFATVEILASSEIFAARLDAYLENTLKAHEGDARYGLLTAAVLSRRNDGAIAREALDAVLAATAGTADAEFASLLTSELDRASRFEDALRVVRSDAGTRDSPLRHEALRRAFYAGRTDEALAAAALDASNLAAADPESLAVASLALRAGGREPEADPLLAELARRTDRVARAWSVVADLGRDGAAQKGLSGVKSLREAAAGLGGSPIAVCALGDALAALGEDDLAIAAWKSAAVSAPAWNRPFRSVASTLLATPGRQHAALGPIRDAMSRAPNDPATISVWVATLAVFSRTAKDADAASFLVALHAARDAAPQCAADVLPVEIELLLRTDRAEAERRLDDLLASSPPPDPGALVHLAAVSGSGPESRRAALLDLCERTHGLTPALALARASVASSFGGDDAALAEFDAIAKRAGAAGGAEWDTARAALLERLGRPEAGAAWIALADAAPEQASPQLRVLASSSARADREGVARIVERLRRITGDDGVNWRVARARWILGAAKTTEAELADTAVLLREVLRVAPDSLPAHRLLAVALERLGDKTRAAEELRAAAALAPGDSSTLLENARLAQSLGRPEVAGRVLDHVLAAPSLGSQSAAQAACILATRGDVRRGIEILEPHTKGPRPDRRATLLLARLCVAAGDAGRGLPACERLLEAPDAETVEVAAALYRALGRRADADAVLARLDALPAEPGERELVRARHAARFDGRDAALEAFRRAAAAAPWRPDPWTAQLAIGIFGADAALVASVLGDPKAAAASEPVRFALGERALLDANFADERVRGLFLTALEDRSHRAALLETARKVALAPKDAAGREARVRSVRALAESNQDVLAILLVACDVCARAGDLDEARTVAGLASRNFPSSAHAARRLAELHEAAGRYDPAADAGMQWRERAHAKDPAADAFVARMLLAGGRPAEVVSFLDEAARAALDHANANAPFLSLHALALVRTGRPSQASEILSVLARDAGRGRTLPLEIPARCLGDARSAAAWIAACAANVPEDDASAQTSLARAYAAAWEQFRAADLEAKAAAAFARLLARPDAPALAHFFAGGFAHQRGDLATARREYSVAMEADAKLLDAKNNLAMLLADTGEWESAVALATELETAQPANTEYLDTLAYALRKGRQFPRARAALERCVELEPANPSWQLSLAEALVESGDRAAAEPVIAAWNAMMLRGVAMPPGARERMEKLRAKSR